MSVDRPPTAPAPLRSRRASLVTALVLASTGMIVVAVIYGSSLPALGNATYQFAGRAAQTTTMPFFVPTEADSMDVRFIMSLKAIRFGTFRVKPDDCIEQLTINGVMVDLRIASICYDASGKSVDLSPYLRAGRNDFEVRLRDYGGAGGIRVEVSSVDPFFLVLCAAFVACALTVAFGVSALASTTPDRGLLAVALGGAIIQLLYLLATHYTMRAHDWGGHVEYIRHVAATLRIPSAAQGWEFHQPPLYYFVTGLYLRLASSLGHGLESMLKTIQTFSLFLTIASFLVALWIGTLLFERRRERTEWLLYSAVIGAMPALVFPAARISNDPLYQLLIFVSFGLLVSWWRRGGNRTWYALLVAASLAISTKNSGIVMLPAIFACLFLRDGLAGDARSSPFSRMQQAALSLVVVLVLAGSVPAWRIATDPGSSRLFTMGNEALDHVLAVETKPRNFLTFNPLAMVEIPENNTYVDDKRRQYFWEFFFRSAFFGEFAFARELRALEHLIVVFGLLALPLVALGFRGALFDAGRQAVPQLLVSGLLVASIVLYRVKYAFAPGQDFRYVTLLAIPLAWAAVKGTFLLPSPWRRLGVIALGSLAGLCALFLVLLLFYP